MKKKNKTSVIIIVIICIVIIGGVLTWGFLTNWGQGKKSEPVKYNVPFSIPQGAKKIEIENPESQGFKIGQKIEIGTDDKKEIRMIVGFGSLILDKPLKYEHPANTEIIVIKEPAKKDFKVNNCKEYTDDLTCKKCGDSYYLEDNKCKEYSHKGTQQDCHDVIGEFTPGTSKSDQTCSKCSPGQWIDIENNECKEYTYKKNQQECNKIGREFTQGTSKSDQTCKKCSPGHGIDSVSKKCQKLPSSFTARFGNPI